MPFRKITLPNGLRIITVPEDDALTTTVLVLVEAGSKYETKDINGLSHFLEHLCFKGTKNRPKAIDIAAELDGIGAAYNAFTAQEWTGYFAKSQPKHFDTILNVVSDLYLNPVFDQNEINKERGVVIEELNMYEDMPMRRVQEFFLNLLYGDQPAGWDVGGRKEVIQKLNREDFLNYRGKHYLAKATLVVVAGKFDEEEAIEKVKQAFSEIAEGEKSGKVKTKETQEKPEMLIKYKDTDQTHLVLGVRAFDIFDKRKYALQLIADILGGGMSSRLFQKIREEMGAAYYVHASSDLYTDHGYLTAASGIDHNKLGDIVRAIVHEFKRLKEDSIPEGELQRAKDHVVGNTMLGLESSDSIAGYYGGQEILLREMITPEEFSQRIQRVTAEEIALVARDIFQNKKLNLAVIGPLKDKEAELQGILKID